MEKIKIERLLIQCPRCGSVRLLLPCEVKKIKSNYCGRCSHIRNLGSYIGARMEKHGHWKGGIQDSRRDGYVMVTLPLSSPYIKMATRGNRVFQHRLVIAQSLSRCLETWEVIHHLNGDKKDNRLENLIIVNSHSPERHAFMKRLQERIRGLEDRIVELERRLEL